MIHVASHPKDLSEWKPNEAPFYYLEVFGEAEPTIDANFAEVVGPNTSAPTPASTSPVYEYWWTIGHEGWKSPHRDLLGGRSDDSLWSNLAETAARVFFYFPIDKGWRIKEIVGTVKYLSPIQDNATLSEQIGSEWQKLQPLLSSAGTASGDLNHVPVIGGAAGMASPILTALSKMQVGTVPTGADGYDWFIEKVTLGSKEHLDIHGVMQGIMWSIPRTMFENLGGRITGSLAVTFIPSLTPDTKEYTPRSGDLLAHAVVYHREGSSDGDQSKYWAPAENDFVHLPIKPKNPLQPKSAKTKAASKTAKKKAAPKP